MLQHGGRCIWGRKAEAEGTSVAWVRGGEVGVVGGVVGMGLEDTVAQLLSLIPRVEADRNGVSRWSWVGRGSIARASLIVGC